MESDHQWIGELFEAHSAAVRQYALRRVSPEVDPGARRRDRSQAGSGTTSIRSLVVPVAPARGSPAAV